VSQFFVNHLPGRFSLDFSISHPLPEVIANFLQEYPFLICLPGPKDWKTLTNAFVIVDALAPANLKERDPYKYQPKLLSLLTRYPWRRDQQFRQEITARARSSPGQHYNDSPDELVEPVLKSLIQRAQQWQAGVRQSFARQSRAYLYEPGRPGAARAQSSFASSMIQLPPECQTRSIQELREVGRLLVGRLTIMELCEIIRRYGPAHGLSLSVPTQSGIAS
jgi:hypothetical protein